MGHTAEENHGCNNTSAKTDTPKSQIISCSCYISEVPKKLLAESDDEVNLNITVSACLTIRVPMRTNIVCLALHLGTVVGRRVESVVGPAVGIVTYNESA